MSKDKPFVSYDERLQRVLSYIYDHLDEDLSLDALADIACMSRYHWHRVFRAMTGETLADVIRRLRLNKAANALLQEEEPIRKIAEQVGYTNLSSFSRAFKIAHGVSPNEFRDRGLKAANLLKFKKGTDDMYPVKITELKEFRAAGALHVGPYQRIGSAFRRLGGILTANSLLPYADFLFAIYHDALDSKPSAEFRSHVAVSIQEEFPDIMDGLEYFNLCGGKYAILEHTGPYAKLKVAYDWLYGTWLPQSGFEPKDAPPIEVYVSDPKITPSKDLRTDIRLPLCS
ncbi:MAG: GyrI-like domain-containing protein [Parasphingorhabdus sp.]